MTKIVVSAETERWTTREADPDEEFDGDDTEGRITDVTAYVETRDNAYYGDSVCVELDLRAGDTVYAVVADYDSGDTFGHSGGHAKVMDAFASEEEADALVAALSGPGTDLAMTYDGQEYRLPWRGYFESLNELKVWSPVVRRNPADPFRKGTGRYSQRNK